VADGALIKYQMFLKLISMNNQQPIKAFQMVITINGFWSVSIRILRANMKPKRLFNFLFLAPYV
jgi:hypothetical protein